MLKLSQVNYICNILLVILLKNTLSLAMSAKLNKNKVLTGIM